MQIPSRPFDRVKTVSFHSKYSGFWTDLSNAKDIVNGKKTLEIISEIESEYLDYFSEYLDYFIDNGYVILPQIIPSEVIDIFVNELEHIKQGKIDGHFVEYADNGRYFCDVPYTLELATKPLKLLDVFSKSKLARDVNLHPRLVRFLSLIFERPVLAFQRLSFFFGTEQPIHQDTAYVRVDSPMEMVATWIALEDIEEGTGELEFYPGSHKLPDYNFPSSPELKKWFQSSESKWWSYIDHEDHDRYLRWLVEKSEQLGLERKKFIARKGDVLIWTNDLANGGSPIEKPNKSRLSLVTHYCPIDRNPYYFYTQLHSEKIQHNQLGFFMYKQLPSRELPTDFNDEKYLKIHPDVAQAAMNPRFHYLFHGLLEGRAYK